MEREIGFFLERAARTRMVLPRRVVLVRSQLTALLVGGGSPLIHVVVNKARAPVYPQVGL